MNSKEKAKELTAKYSDYVNPYIGSGMLSNSYDDGAILMQSKSCAQVTVKEIIEYLKDWKMDDQVIQYWVDVSYEIDKL